MLCRSNACVSKHICVHALSALVVFKFLRVVYHSANVHNFSQNAMISCRLFSSQAFSCVFLPPFKNGLEVSQKTKQNQARNPQRFSPPTYSGSGVTPSWLYPMEGITTNDGIPNLAQTQKMCLLCPFPPPPPSHIKWSRDQSCGSDWHEVMNALSVRPELKRGPQGRRVFSSQAVSQLETTLTVSSNDMAGVGLLSTGLLSFIFARGGKMLNKELK